MNIREIESMIDHEHDNHQFFNVSKEQAIYELLITFEDLCNLSMKLSILNPVLLSKITNYMDALNMALQWVEKTCESDSVKGAFTDISEKRYNDCKDLLMNYAYPYSVICGGYILFSRKRFSANVDNKTVTFNVINDNNDSAWYDILRESREYSFEHFARTMDFHKISEANADLQKSIWIENGMLCYKCSNDIIEAFNDIACKHWNATRTLPETWRFDLFTLEEYKRFWICLASLCYIHFFACLSINDATTRIKNSVIIKKKRI